MKRTSMLKSTKRFGTRYGKAIKLKVDYIESLQRSKHKCPVCKKVNAKRTSSGIFVCKSCGAKFSSRSYVVNKK